MHCISKTINSGAFYLIRVEVLCIILILLSYFVKNESSVGSCIASPKTSLSILIVFWICRLLSAILRVSEVESRAIRANLTHLLSPQMGKDIVWFLKRWAKTYLLVDEKLYDQVRILLLSIYLWVLAIILSCECRYQCSYLKVQC